MGIFDKAKDAAANAGDLADKAKGLVEEHGDKLPGDLGDKAAEMTDKASEMADKIPGQDAAEEE